VAASAAAAVEAAQQWLGDTKAVNRWLKRPELNLAQLLADGGGLAKVRGFLPSHVADGVRQAVEAVHSSQWERAGEGSGDDAGYEDRVNHHFSIADVEGDPTLLGAARVLGKLLPGTLPNFSAACYWKKDYIAPHDDLVPESYSLGELRRVEAAYNARTGLVPAASAWQRSSSSTGDLEDALEAGDIESVKQALASGAVTGGTQKMEYVRVVALAYYLNQDWPAAFGGHFVDLAGKGKEKHLPEFNTLLAFEVPRRHAVAEVCAPKGRGRYSIFGWWLMPEASLLLKKSKRSSTVQRRPDKLSVAALGNVRRKPAAVARTMLMKRPAAAAFPGRRRADNAKSGRLVV
jgi:hypothetical protein